MAILDKSLRTKSVIMMFSERSFSLFSKSCLDFKSCFSSLNLLAVPFMGCEISNKLSFLRNLSGDAHNKYC